MSPLEPSQPPLARNEGSPPEGAEGGRGLPRRRFLQLMGASMALAQAASCRWEEETILAFKDRPDDRVPGTSRRFATAYETGGVAAGLLLTSYDGRPIKVEGSPLHPHDRGAADLRSQAAVLDVYDPDHSSGLVQLHEGRAWPRTWAEFDPFLAELATAWRKRGGRGVCVLAEPTSSKTMADLRTRFREAYPEASWVEYQPLDRRNEVEGARLAFGRPVRTVLRVQAAETLLCLDADLLADHPTALENARGLSQSRKPDRATMNRTWAVESRVSLTGGAADHRLALRSEQVLPFALALERRVAARCAVDVNDSRYPGPEVTADGFLREERVSSILQPLCDELCERAGRCLVTAGAHQPPALHAVVHRLNALLDNVGTTLRYVEEPEADVARSVDDLAALTEEMRAGEVEHLLILGGNPVYDAPADFEFRRALREVRHSVHLGETRNETSRACTWHLPRAHAFESWGDARAWDGTRCTMQPLIAPLFERRTPIELVAALVGEKAPTRDLVKRALVGDNGEKAFRRALHGGVVEGSALSTVDVTLQRFELPASPDRANRTDVQNGELELRLYADTRIHDGRGGNNGWLQETPDPITKLTWGNAALFAPSTAEELGVENETFVRLRVGTTELEVPALVVPGQARGSVALALGYGRRGAGRVGGLEDEGIEEVGSDAYRLRTRAAMDIVPGLEVEPLGAPAQLATTQAHPLIDDIGREGRAERLHELYREASLEYFKEHPDFAKHAVHHPPLKSLWTSREDPEARWGMTIDLNACTGCSACAVACQAENNIPVVGAEEVSRGREMAWMRIDRYFAGETEDPDLVFAPVACSQCENAPCEQVCPVGATLHSSEGLNEMVYNRCIGTRYCANNCPYKVRRFNWFDNHPDLDEPGAEVQRMVYNPEVTLRHRGVMEKCTYCVQRIQAAKITAKNEARDVQDGEIVPACGQTCPTNAITFGDLSDADSEVSRQLADVRSYQMLEELNIKPRTSYLARIRNPHPALSDDEHPGAH